IYTSGSTGKPKGTAIKAHSFTNLINWFTREFEIGKATNIILVAPVSFDLAQKNLYSPLVKGGILTILPEKALIDAPLIIEKYKATIINCTPSAFQIILDFDRKHHFKNLKTLK